jgi:UPF0288 family protein (methanogenesis marker protein 3)
MAKVKVDGTEIEVRDDMTILQACEKLGKKYPDSVTMIACLLREIVECV